jgi:hypothetical protein
MASKGPSEGAFKRSSFQSPRITATPSPKASGSSTAVQTQPVSSSKLTQEMIAGRAKAIWQAKGCPAGQDEQNWLEAERQLRAELGRH